MHSGQGHYHYHTPRQACAPQQNARSASPSKPSPSNYLIARIHSPGASPPHPQNMFNPRPPSSPSATHGLAPVGQQHTEEAQNGDVALPSEETVDAFLASVLTTDVVASRLQAPSASAAQPSAPPPAAHAHPVASASASASVLMAHLPGSSASTTQSTPTTHSDPALLSSARALLLPHLLANARARDLGEGGKDGQWEGPRAAEVERRALELATDEWCTEMIAHARRVRAEMRRRANEEAEGQKGSDGEETMSMDVDSAVGAETDDMGADGVARSAKAGTGEDAREDVGMQDVRMSTPQEAADSNKGEREAEDVQERPVLPGETMLDSAARVLQDFIASTPRPRSAVRDEATSSVQPHTAGSSTNNDPALATEDVSSKMAAPDAEPGLWAIRVGSRVPEIVTVTFDVHESAASAAQRWARRHTGLDQDASHIWVHLLCLPALAVAEANSSLGASAGSAAVADALWDIQTQWPPKGTLIVEVNGGDPAHARTFLPIHLETTGGPVDLTPHIRPGTNTIRLIQLRNLSEWVFVVHVDVPDDDERAPFAAPDAEAQEWAAFVARASTRHRDGAIVSTPVAVAVAPV